MQQQHKEISWSEFNFHLNNLKPNKAAGEDNLKEGAFIYADQDTKNNIKMIMQRCMNGQPIPQEWRESTIWPIHKKGARSLVENYRGIAIGNVIHKLFASIINSRLEQHVEDQNILPDTQNGFRKRRSTIDNIYIMNHTINAKLAEGKKLYAFFVDLKAAFDSVDRDLLFQKLKQLKIPDYLIAAIKNMYIRTPFKVGKHTFYTDKGLKQGCPLSPLLFALFVSDLETTLKNFKAEGSLLENKKYLASRTQMI